MVFEYCRSQDIVICQLFLVFFPTDPDFVSAYEVDDHIYFFYREVAVEYINCGKVCIGYED